MSFFSRKRCYSKSPVRTSNLDLNPQKLWPYTRPNDKDITIFFLRAVYAFHHVQRHCQSDENQSWLLRERCKTQWNRDMNLQNNHLFTWAFLTGRLLTVCNLTCLQKLVFKITLNRISVKSWDDVTIQLMRQCTKLFDHEKLSKPNRWQSMIPKYFWMIIDWPIPIY